MAVGAVIFAIGWALFWFEIAHAFGALVSALGFGVIVWGQVVYIRALRLRREDASDMSRSPTPRTRRDL
jgi:hypothetical protein